MSLPRVMFASYHCYHDPSSGAAVCTRDLFAALSKRGYACSVFTGPYLDDHAAAPVSIALRDRPGLQIVRGTAGPYQFVMHTSAETGGYPATVFATDPPMAARLPTKSDTESFLAVFADQLYVSGELTPSVVG